MSLAVTDAVLGGKLVGLRAERGAIAELGPGVRPRQGDTAIDAAGAILVPPLVNGTRMPR
jgi:cytosine/adenosine deaminase-related metal-dependent hydrolase